MAQHLLGTQSAQIASSSALDLIDPKDSYRSADQRAVSCFPRDAKCCLTRSRAWKVALLGGRGRKRCCHVHFTSFLDSWSMQHSTGHFFESWVSLESVIHCRYTEGEPITVIDTMMSNVVVSHR